MQAGTSILEDLDDVISIIDCISRRSFTSSSPSNLRPSARYSPYTTQRPQRRTDAKLDLVNEQRIQELTRLREMRNSLSPVKDALNKLALKFDSVCQDRNQAIECPACLDKTRRPYLLPMCKHSACYGCLLQMINARDKDQRRCWICRANSTSPPERYAVVEDAIYCLETVLGQPNGTDETRRWGSLAMHW